METQAFNSIIEIKTQTDDESFLLSIPTNMPVGHERNCVQLE